MSLVYRRARSDEAALVAEMWDEAREWLAEKGQDQWQYPVDHQKILNAIQAGECWLVELTPGDVVATLTLDGQADNEFWRPEDDPEDALYVHRMIVARRASGRGIGRNILDWAGEKSAEAGKRWLRLDAWRTNEQLLNYYQGLGFQLVRVVQLPHRRSGAVFQRRA